MTAEIHTGTPSTAAPTDGGRLPIEFIRYVALGLANAAVGAVLLVVMVFGLGVPYVAAHVITHLLVVTGAYLPSSRWVFERNVRPLAGLARFHLSYGVHLAVSTGVLYVLVRSGALPIVPAQLVGAGLAAVCNFVLQRIFVFHPRHEVPPRLANDMTGSTP